jgi:L-threonylcarbamoyladenylate synthase
VRVRTTHDVEDAVGSLVNGGLVALPTETVYGLAGDASSPDAVARIFEVKGRPSTHPVIVHLPDESFVDRWAWSVPGWARTLVAELWPGPLTLVVPRASGVLDAVTGGQETVGLRVPAHSLTLDVLHRFGGGLAAPSANRYGHVSPTTAAHVVDELDDYLDPDRDLVLDGGACPVGVESTIVGAWDETPVLLRPGAVTADQIEAITGRAMAPNAGGIRVPGSTATHYAPHAQVVVVERNELGGALASRDTGTRTGLIAPADVGTPSTGVVRLAAPAEENEYAQTLYAAMREADDCDMDVVVVVLPEPKGIGAAVRDRLLRAAATHRVDR